MAAGAADRAEQWRDIPAAPPPHGTVLAWHKGCRCAECDAGYREFLAELEQRARDRQGRGEPFVPRLSADDRAHIDPAVRAGACPLCGALRNHRCRNPHFPMHFAATHPERVAG